MTGKNSDLDDTVDFGLDLFKLLLISVEITSFLPIFGDCFGLILMAVLTCFPSCVGVVLRLFRGRFELIFGLLLMAVVVELSSIF